MNVRTLCLAMLAFGESSGYDIRKRASEGAYRHFADASYGSIYPALAKLAEDGCVEHRQEVQAGRPPRKVYSITEKGLAEFREVLGREVEPDVFRSPFLLLALCAEMVRPEDMERAIDRQVANMRNDLAQIEADAAESAAPGARWVERFARHTVDASLDFINRNRDELIALAGSGRGRRPFADAAE